MTPPLPRDEASRLEALERYEILDTPREPAFDDLARLAALACRAPLALVSFVDGSRQWTKAAAGPEGACHPAQLPRDESFCAHTVAAARLTVVEDVARDPRFAGRPHGGGTWAARFYAGAPILSAEGHAIGSVCVMDRAPRTLSPEERDALVALGRQAARALELRQHVALLEREIEVRAAAEAALFEREQELQLSEARNRRLAEATLDGVVIMVETRIVEVNRRFCELFGVTEPDAIGRSVLDFAPPEAHDTLLRHHREETETTYESLGRRADGTVFALEASARACTWNGRPARLAVIRDITERQEVDRLKSEFVSTVSHELRTPLTSIRGSLGLIEAGVVGEVSPRARELTRIARANADRLIRLINDILDLEKMQAGRLDMRVAPQDPADVVTTTLEELQGMAEQRRVRLVARLARHDRFLGDRDRVAQVLTNLVSNALKFAPEDSEVAVRVAAAARPGFLRFAVEDTGPGIPAGKLDRLFRRFAQLDAGDARERGGTGLGLAISRTIVEQLGGRIGVDSEPHVQTRFWFELPMLVVPREPAVGEDAAGAPHEVLVVEDDRDLADILSILLAHEGFGVTHVPTLRDAALALDRRAPAVILLDVMLPDGDGLEFIAARRASHGLVTPVVVLSGHEAAERAGVVPVREWLVKPSDERHLFAALRRAIRPPGPPRVLVVDADAESRAVRMAQLATWSVECEGAGSGADALAIARQRQPDLIVLDPALPALEGLDLVSRLRDGPTRATPLLVHSSSELTGAERRALALGPTIHLVKSRASEAELADAMRSLLDAFALATGEPA